MSPNKYHNIKVEYDGYKFDSKKEMAFYQELVLRKKAGDITYFSVKPTCYVIGDKDGWGLTWDKSFAHSKTILFSYTPDFVITNVNFSEEFIDVKGVQTPVFKLKKRILEALGIKITIV